MSNLKWEAWVTLALPNVVESLYPEIWVDVGYRYA